MRIATKLMIVLALLMVTGACAKADVITVWTINANFTYNSTSNTETGSFTYDATTGQITTWNITVAGTNTLADNNYTPSDSFLTTNFFPTTSPAYVSFYDNSGPGNGDYLDLDIASALNGTGGTFNLLAGNNGANYQSTIVCNGCGILNTNDTNTVTGAVVGAPEPGTLGLMGTGLMSLIGIAVLRRRKSAAFIGAQ
ncbi:MAG TPA: PEP-CTERM sorting domain-containing protein [Candidatus Acidoferrum sp.]|nr:PEP-CTERM sorting domain-containing protein [Candidatus Acidoferrum sp.]